MSKNNQLGDDKRNNCRDGKKIYLASQVCYIFFTITAIATAIASKKEGRYFQSKLYTGAFIGCSTIGFISRIFACITRTAYETPNIVEVNEDNISIKIDRNLVFPNNPKSTLGSLCTIDEEKSLSFR